jgi:hypothetical protein
VQIHSRTAAWVQAGLLVAVCMLIAAVLVVRLHRPFDQDTLAIQVEELQSDAAEAAVLAQNAREDRLAPVFVRRQASQMANKVESVQSKLRSKAAYPPLEPIRNAARQHGASLHAALQAWSSDAGSPQADPAGLEAIAQQLDDLKSQLKPGQ